MAVIRWNPWNIAQWFEEDFELPASLAQIGLGQGINIYETEDAVVAEVAVPGVSRDRLDITVEDRIVRINASREEKKEEREKRRGIMSTLRASYSYAFRLPASVASEQEPKAQLYQGILTLTFPKMEKKAPKKVQVMEEK